MFFPPFRLSQPRVLVCAFLVILRAFLRLSQPVCLLGRGGESFRFKSSSNNPQEKSGW